MSGHPRRPPPGKSFPFLRKGDGQRTKRAASSPKSRETREDQQQQSEGRIQTYSRLDGAGTDGNVAWKCTFVTGTVQTNVNGSAKEFGSPKDDDESSSSSEEISPTSSSIPRLNIDLRKQNALPLQKVAREENYSLTPPTVGSSSPMLASTPQPRPEWELPQPSQHVPPAVETSILGDITNQADETALSPENEKKSPGHRDVNIPAARVALHQAGSIDNAGPIGKSHAGTTSHPISGHDIRALRQRGGYTDVEKKLVEQLRNAIAHLDLADMEQQRKAREVCPFLCFASPLEFFVEIFSLMLTTYILFDCIYGWKRRMFNFVIVYVNSKSKRNSRRKEFSVFVDNLKERGKPSIRMVKGEIRL
ncbi:hypothetical protein KIN20_002260 [Parelaphostrongylus tenuis]|uniref:Uncharacterized protein n=1 Tax=Parelaphostrongylus tenuis TaxID=148309 RepID=A0AAD5LY77_PARTN|nr:hypothetical protein KIN20_002260 [Parelaphostrongylus tenuis]